MDSQTKQVGDLRLLNVAYSERSALGAWAAVPDRPIVRITGDGGFGQEIEGAIKTGLAVKGPALVEIMTDPQLI